MNLLLIGFRGTGKSTVGRRLAERLGWTFVDADDELETRLGTSIAAIFAERGEAAFRDQESELLVELLAGTRCVIALGGGAIVREQNRAHLRGAGTVVWLQAEPQCIVERLARDPRTGSQRPALTGLNRMEEVVELLRVRNPLYAESADLAVVTEGRSVDAIVDEIVCFLQTPPRNSS
ncbi:MAG: shikimate kinase [Planctomycetes bacterium]|nr:shikimate kinase [Planctomycetota bacterium]